MAPLRIAWLTTGRGPGSYGALEYTLKAIRRGLPVEIVVVLLNRTRGEAAPTDRLIAMAEQADIPVETLSSIAFRRERGGKISKPGEPLQPWRLDYDREVADLLGRHEFEIGVMFGYMLIATEPLYSRFRFINDHPALPDGPVGTYQEVIAELMRTRADESGCMMNVVTGDVDRGAAVSYCRYAIRDDRNGDLWRSFAGVTTGDETVAEIQETPLYQDIRERGVERERPFLVETLRAVAEERLAVPPTSPVDLTRDVEAALGYR
jgi:phosphoribosylglycinamide formyltransferase-1